MAIRRDIENQIRSLIKEYGLLFPRAIGLQFRNQVRKLLGEDHLLLSVTAPLLSIHEQICKEQSKFDNEVRQLAKSDETTRRLMTVPGVGAPSVAGLDLEAVDEIDHIVEAATGTGSNAASGNGDGKMGLAGANSTDQDDVALLSDEAAAGEIVDERLVDRCSVELEVRNVLGQRQLGDGELVLDRAGLLLVDLGVEQIADDALGLCWRLTAVAMISSNAAFMP